MKRILGLSVLAALAASVLFLACPSRGDIKIGAILPLTGPAAEFGNWMKQGLDMAADDLNQHGGIAGRRVSLLYEDSQGDPKSGLAAYQKLRAIDKVKFFFTSISGVTMAILPEATKDSVLVVTSSTHPDITAGKYLVLRIYFTPDQEATAMADHAAKRLGLKRVGVIYLNDESLSGYYQYFANRMKELGAETYGQSYEAGATDFRTQLVKIKSWKPDGIYVGGWKENGAILRQIRQLGIAVPILGPVTFDSPQTVAIAGAAAEGVVFTVPRFDTTVATSEQAAFIKEYQSRFHQPPEVNAALFYDGLQTLAIGIAKTNGSPVKTAEAVKSIRDYHGALGVISYRANGDIEMPVGFKKIVDGKFVVLPSE
jgi:branched-chain amino acid transport system substrate-binding protein